MTEAEIIADLRAEVEWLREQLWPSDFHLGYLFGFTKSEARILDALRSSAQVITKERIYNALYWDEDKGRDPKIVDVMICKLRKRLAAENIKVDIVSVWGRGYTVNAEVRDYLNQRRTAFYEAHARTIADHRSRERVGGQPSDSGVGRRGENIDSGVGS